MPDSRRLVVVDTSVAINLNATGCATAILGAVPYAVVLTNVVQGKLLEDRRSGRGDAALLETLVSSGHVRIVSLDEAALRVFGDLVAGPSAETLDDGEAATIAYAVTHDAVPIIDERKARRICTERFTGLRPLSTVDILAEPAVNAALGRSALADSVFLALRNARMRVLPERIAWVVALIGNDRASQCPSLPRHVRSR